MRPLPFFLLLLPWCSHGFEVPHVPSEVVAALSPVFGHHIERVTNVTVDELQMKFDPSPGQLWGVISVTATGFGATVEFLSMRAMEASVAGVGPVTVTVNLTKPGVGLDATEASVTKLEARFEDMTCTLPMLFPMTCEELRITAATELALRREELMRNLSRTLSGLMQNLSEAVASDPPVPPAVAAGVQEAPFEGMAGLLNTSASSWTRSASHFVTNFLGAPVAGGAGTVLGQVLNDSQLTSSTVNLGGGVAMQVQKIGVPSVGLSPLGARSLLLSLELGGTDATIEAPFIGSTELRNVAAQVNISLLLAVNETQLGTLPLLSLESPPEGTTTAACWLQHPVLLANLSTANVSLTSLQVLGTPLGEAALFFFPNAIDYALRMAVLRSAAAALRRMATRFPHLPGDSPCSVTPGRYVLPPSYQVNFQRSRVLRAVGWILNVFLGPSAVGALVDAAVSRHRTGWHITIQSPKVGTVVLEVGRLQSTTRLKSSKLLVPAGPDLLRNDVVLQDVQLSFDFYVSVTGGTQAAFSDNITLSFDIEELAVALEVETDMNATSLLLTPLKDAPCIFPGSLKRLRLPLAMGNATSFSVDAVCSVCESPGFPQLHESLTSVQGAAQLQAAMQTFLEVMLPHITSSSVADAALDKLTTKLQDRCTRLQQQSRQEDTDSKSMSATTALLIVFGWVGFLAALLLLHLVYAAWQSDPKEEGGFGHALVSDPSLPLTTRLGIPFLLVGTMGLIVSANLPTGAEVHAVVGVGGSPVQVHNILAYALGNAISEMWDGGAYVLSVLIMTFSGMWPYSKLLLLLWGWLCPPSALSPANRLKVFQILDLAGKWSLIDSFMMIMMMVAFRLHLVQPPEWMFLPQDFLVFDLYVSPRWGLYAFMTAAIISLAINHYMVICHRNVESTAESRGAITGWFQETGGCGEERVVLAKRTTYPKRVCLVLSLVISMILLIVGSSVETFRFEFKGLVAWALDGSTPEKQEASYSLLNLAVQVGKQGKTLGHYYLSGTFLLFAFVMPLLQTAVLLALWVVPLTLREQKLLFFVNEVVAAWSMVEVFVLVIIASLLQISEIAKFMIGNSCNLINPEMQNVVQPLGYLTQYEPTCYDVRATLSHGCWILFAAAVTTNIAYAVAWRHARVVIELREAMDREKLVNVQEET